jgi:hypothetical protein
MVAKTRTAFARPTSTATITTTTPPNYPRLRMHLAAKAKTVVYSKDFGKLNHTSCNRRRRLFSTSLSRKDICAAAADDEDDKAAPPRIQSGSKTDKRLMRLPSRRSDGDYPDAEEQRAGAILATLNLTAVRNNRYMCARQLKEVPHIATLRVQ